MINMSNCTNIKMRLISYKFSKETLSWISEGTIEGAKDVEHKFNYGGDLINEFIKSFNQIM